MADVLRDPRADQLDIKTPRFWLLVAALKAFMANEGAGLLPVSTNIPDMTSESSVYVKLKQMCVAHRVLLLLDCALVAKSKSTFCVCFASRRRAIGC